MFWIDFNVVDWGYGWCFFKYESVIVGVGGFNLYNFDMKVWM